MMVELELIKDDLIGVRFDYDAVFVRGIKMLSHRKWNPRKRRWEVHIGHLKEIVSIFNLQPVAIPSAVQKQFDEHAKKPALVVELDVLQGRIHGLRFPMREIDDALSYPLPGHRFSPKFKSGRWDGKRHLFSTKSCKFPAGLWPYVQKILKAHDLEWKTKRTGRAAKASIVYPEPATTLRDYQTKAVTAALKKKRGILQIATGGGKTLIAAHLIQKLGRRAVFFVHTRELLHQTAEVFRSELGIEIGLLGDGHATTADITVATLQTVSRVFDIAFARAKGTAAERALDEEAGAKREAATRLGKRKEEIRAHIESAEVVIFDECHHVPADTAFKIAFKTPNAPFRFGLSATPWRDDHNDMLLEAALGPRLCKINASTLIDLGFLVRPTVTMHLAKTDIPIPHRADYPDVYRMAIVENQLRNRAIAAAAREWSAQGLSVLILVAQVAHGRLIEELLPEAGFAYGALDMDTRRALVRDLERKLHPVLIATTLADEGLDIPSLDAVILAGGGKSATKAYQRIGRALRPAKGKSRAHIMDFFDRANYVEGHSVERLRLYRDEPAFDVETRGFKA